jgi:hypothetical protein
MPVDTVSDGGGHMPMRFTNPTVAWFLGGIRFQKPEDHHH